MFQNINNNNDLMRPETKIQPKLSIQLVLQFFLIDFIHVYLVHEADLYSK